MPDTNQPKSILDTRPWRHLPVVSVAIVALAATLMPLGELSAWLQYDRAAVEAGQLWRLLTCQLTHWSWDHLFWDAVAILFLGWVIEREDRRALLTCVGLSAVLIPAAVHFALPEMATYRGLSGIDSAAFVLLAVTLLRKCLAQQDRVWTWACAAMLAGFSAKVGFELCSGSALFVDVEASRMLPVPLAHVTGGILGAFCASAGRSSRVQPASSRPVPSPV